MDIDIDGALKNETLEDIFYPLDAPAKIRIKIQKNNKNNKKNKNNNEKIFSMWDIDTNENIIHDISLNLSNDFVMGLALDCSHTQHTFLETTICEPIS